MKLKDILAEKRLDKLGLATYVPTRQPRPPRPKERDEFELEPEQ